MNKKTISAISTPMGEGAIGVIRISGNLAFKIIREIFRPIIHRKFEKFKSHHLYRGWIVNKGKEIDEVMAVIMRKPNSYTGEDLVEIYAHGGPAVLSAIIDLINAGGARLAEAGEFTQRAYLNGKIDLTQAESVAWMIEAESEQEIRDAVQQLKGSLKKKLEKIKQEIVKSLAMVEVSLDFEEIEKEKICYHELKERLKRIKKALLQLENQANAGRVLREGLKVVIVGKPNVGKSSLLNKFLKQKRAIVSVKPGTTRDTIEEIIRVGGKSLRIIDTAGIRSTREGIEEESVKRAIEKIEEADLVLMVLDSGTSINDEDMRVLQLLKDKRALIIVNKTDLPAKIKLNSIERELRKRKIVRISAQKNWGLPRLKKEINNIINENFIKKQRKSVIISQSRRYLIKQAIKACERAIYSTEKIMSGEFIAVDLWITLKKVKEISGEEYSDGVLEEIFSRFCVGK